MHSWRFFRAGGLDQVRLDTGADLAHLDELDPKLWVALSCPVKGLEFDEKTLALLDTDGDGRVRVTEILAAVKFCREALSNLDGLVRSTDAVPLASLAATDTGKGILGAAKQILGALGKADASTVTLADVTNTAAIFANTRFNGDGVIIPASTDEAALAATIGDIVATVGSVPDRSGTAGVDKALVDKFFEQLAADAAWRAAGTADTQPLGDATAAAADAVEAVRAKVDDAFARARLAGYDARAEAALQPADAAYAAVADKALSASGAEVAHLPLARLTPGQALPLSAGVNPAWAAAMATLRDAAVKPLLGAKDTLTEADWAALQAKVAPFLAWRGQKPATATAGLDAARAAALLASTAQADLHALITKDEGTAADFANVATLEKLVRYHRDLYRLVRNFVSFEDFYAPDTKAIFQAGTLFLDSRACDLCVRVDDAGRHAAMAGLSKCYLAYCDIHRAGEPSRQIAAVFSGGDSDFLMVGRNGVFYDRQGRDWDATITKVVENPISLREAFFSPYKRFVRMVEEQVAKRAAAADAEAHATLANTAQATAHVDKAAPPKPAFDLSSIALIGVAVSGATAVLGGLLQAFFGLGIWMPFGIVAIILCISGPSMLIAGLKLRQRNLGPVLDANGWAINGRVVVNIPFGGSLTQLKAFPAGAERSFVDPYAPKKSLWGPALWAVGLAAAALFSAFTGYHNGWFPASIEHRFLVFGVPWHLYTEKDVAQKSVDDAKAVLTSAQEQQAAAKKTLDDLVAANTEPGAKLDRAKARLDRSEAKLARAEDRLDHHEERLLAATEALEAAIDADERRAEAAEAEAHPTK